MMLTQCSEMITQAHQALYGILMAYGFEVVLHRLLAQSAWLAPTVPCGPREPRRVDADRNIVIIARDSDIYRNGLVLDWEIRRDSDIDGNGDIDCWAYNRRECDVDSSLLHRNSIGGSRTKKCGQCRGNKIHASKGQYEKPCTSM